MPWFIPRKEKNSEIYHRAKPPVHSNAPIQLLSAILKLHNFVSRAHRIQCSFHLIIVDFKWNSISWIHHGFAMCVFIYSIWAPIFIYWYLFFVRSISRLHGNFNAIRMNSNFMLVHTTFVCICKYSLSMCVCVRSHLSALIYCHYNTLPLSHIFLRQSIFIIVDRSLAFWNCGYQIKSKTFK